MTFFVRRRGADQNVAFLWKWKRLAVQGEGRGAEEGGWGEGDSMAWCDMQPIHVFTVQDGKRDIMAAITGQPDTA